MAKKQDESFSHGWGAFQRGTGSLKTKIMMLVLLVLIGAGAGGYLGSRFMTESERAWLWLWKEAHWEKIRHPFPNQVRVVNFSWQGQEYNSAPDDVLAITLLQASVERAKVLCGIGAGVGTGAAFVLWLLWIRMVRRRGRALLEGQHVRGARLAEAGELAKLAKKAAKSAGESGPWICIGDVPLPRHLEPRGMMIAGTVGSGKTTVLRQALDVIAERGDAAVVYDPSLTLLRTYYQPGYDVLLNPLDARGAFWNPFAEIQMPSDCDAIAAQLAQGLASTQGEEWVGYSRLLVGSVLWKLYQQGRRTLDELHAFVATIDKDGLQEFCRDTKAARLFTDGAVGATSSVVFMLSRPAALLAPLRRTAGAGGRFSWTEYVQGIDTRQGRAPWVFMATPERMFDTMRGLLGCWIDCAATALLSLPEQHDRRLFFVLDEFAALPKIEKLPRLAAMGRKFGGAMFAGVQSPSQLVATYGREDAQTLTATLGTQLFLRLPGGEPARWASQMLGRTERETKRPNDVYETDQAADRSSLTTVREINDLVLDGDISALPDLDGYLRLPVGNAPIARITIPTAHLDRPYIAEGYVPGAVEDTYLHTVSPDTVVPPTPTRPHMIGPLGLGGRP
jgi:hypothetical protein